jgi:hypothetical protein
MNINIEEMKKRLKMLMDEKAMQEQLYIQTQSNINAYNGAIAECQHWIKTSEDIVNNKVLEDASDMPHNY